MAKMHALSYIIATAPQGHALCCDYGEIHAFSNSFRGIRLQKLLKDEQILKFTGECDLSSYVNFAALRRVVKSYPSLNYCGLMRQENFLELMMISSRVKILQDSSNDMNHKENIMQQYRKLCDHNEMGDIFKFMYFHKINDKPVYPFLEDVLAQANIKI